MRRKHLPTAMASGTASTPMNPEPKEPSGPTLPEATLSEDMYHQKCKTLLYSTYIEIQTTGSLSLLTICGEPTEDQLEQAWDEIQQEYSDLIRTEKTTNVFDLYQKLSYTRFKLEYLGWVLPYLKAEYKQEYAERIASLGYDLIEWNEDREKYLQQIYLVENDAKFLIVQLNQLSSEYKKINPGASGSDVERTAMDYEKELAILSRFMGRWIRASEITVFEFCAIVNAYLETNKLK